MIDVSDYEKLKVDAQVYYHQTGRLLSPALDKEVSFSAEGFNHLIYKNHRSERDKSSQILRFKLLPLAVKLISLSTTHQEYEETLKEVRVINHGKSALKSKLVRYWGDCRYYWWSQDQSNYSASWR